MLLSGKTIEYIDNVTAVAAIANIDAIVFTPTLVSGKDDTPSVVLIQTHDIPEFEFEELAIIRIPYFRQRMEAVKSASGKEFTIDYTPTSGLVIMKNGRTKAEYRAGNPAAVRPPKAMNDTPEFAFTIDQNLVTVIGRAASAYPSKDPMISFTSNGSEVEMTIMDDEAGDSFTSLISNDLDAEKNLNVRYSLKTLLPLLKHHDNTTLLIGGRGIMTLSIKGIQIGLIPRV